MKKGKELTKIGRVEQDFIANIVPAARCKGKSPMKKGLAYGR